MNVTMRSRVRERRTHGSVRGLRREPLVYSTFRKYITDMAGHTDMPCMNRFCGRNKKT